MKTTLARNGKARKVPRFVLFLFLGAVLALTLYPFFLRPLRSYAQWTLHRKATFEKQSILIPVGWSEGTEWHLLSLRKPHFFRYALSESTIVVDPFAERHPGHVEEAWQLWSHDWGRPVKVIAGARCAQANFYASGSGKSMIDCLSLDSTVMFQFNGYDDDLPAFRDIYRQASAIVALHPGQIQR